ncbi:unnamed protein product [Caenorhabditis angaria]|uniref:Uncharacterized protein n=1 Tax=Caenorhabditis angaria TaxID=860376 RepID=A0A9P1N177_9PELO|nr:unnamed protein product [Caenorhabditis angaria]
MINEFLGTRKLERKEDLTETEIFKKKEIALDISFGYDRKKNGEDSTESTDHSSTINNKYHIDEENYENDFEEAISPVLNKEPDPLRMQLEDLEQQLTAQNTQRIPYRRQLCLMISSASLIAGTIDFAVCFFHHGGVYFLIPYFICLIFLAIPAAIFEISMGQFVSTPIFGIFHKMAPILGGIPYLILFQRFITLLSVAIQPKFYLYTVRLLLTLITDVDQWSSCKDYPQILCYEVLNDCKLNEFFDGSKCVKDDDSDKVIRFLSPYALMDLAKVRYLQHTGFTASTLFNIAKSLDISDNLTALIVFYSITGYLFYLGYRSYAKFSMFLVLLPFFGLIPVVFICLKDVSDYPVQIIMNILYDANNFGKMIESMTWLHAFRVACTSMELSTGHLATLGSKLQFRHNFFKDVCFMAVFASFYRILFTMCIIPIFLFIRFFIFPASDMRYAANEEEMKYNMLEALFKGLPVITKPGMRGKVLNSLFALFFLTINLGSITYQLITFEVIMSYAYRIFPRLLYVTEKYARLAIFGAITALSLVIMSEQFHEALHAKVEFRRETTASWFFAGYFIVLFAEFVGVQAIYGNRRIFVNCMTMLHSHRSSFAIFMWMKKPIIYAWGALPFISAILIIHYTTSLFTNISAESLLNVLIVGFPLLYVIRISLTTVFYGKKFALIGMSYRYGPRNANNAREAAADEKAFILQD